jgi:hypothetical protein
MRRITAWITATVTVLALMFSYQLNVSGAVGKAGDNAGGSATAGTNAKAGESK